MKDATKKGAYAPRPTPTPVPKLPGFSDTSIFARKSGHVHHPQEGMFVGVARNVHPDKEGKNKLPTQMLFYISPDAAKAVGFKDGDLISIHFQAKPGQAPTFAITKGGHRQLKKDGHNLRTSTVPLYSLLEYVRAEAVVVPSTGIGPNDFPAYLSFSIPAGTAKNPAMWEEGKQKLVEGTREADEELVSDADLQAALRAGHDD